MYARGSTDSVGHWTGKTEDEDALLTLLVRAFTPAFTRDCFRQSKVRKFASRPSLAYTDYNMGICFMRI